MDHRLLEIVACPVCKGKLTFDKDKQELVCKIDRLAYPIKEEIPINVMWSNEKIQQRGDYIYRSEY